MAVEVAAAVLLPAVIVVLGAERFFLAVADERDAAAGNAQVREVLLGARGAALALAIASCAGIPKSEINEAEKSINDSRSVNAGKYAPRVRASR